MRLIPGKTKVKIELFKGVTLGDMLVGAVAVLLLVLIVISNLPYKIYFVIGLLTITAALLFRLNSEPTYIYLLHVLKHFAYPRHYARIYDDELLILRYAEDGKEKIAERMFGRKKKKKVQVKDQKEAEENNHEAVEDQEQQPLTEEQEQDRQKGRKKGRKEKKAEKPEKKQKSKKKKEEDRKDRSKKVKKAARETAEEIDAGIKRKDMQDIIAFTGIRDGVIEYGGAYYGAVLEIPPVEFRFFSEHRRNLSIENGLGRILRSISVQYSANIVKLERPVQYDSYVEKEYDKLDRLKESYEKGLITEEELKARVEVLYDRLNELLEMTNENKVVVPFYYLVLFESDKHQLELQIANAIDALQTGELEPKRLRDRELALFLKYSNQLDFDETEIDKIPVEAYAEWAMPQNVDIKMRTVEVNHIVTHNFRIANYASLVGDAWMAGVMSIPGTKCVMKCRPMDRSKAIRTIDRSLQELRGQYITTSVDSRQIELQAHIDTLSELLVMLQQDNETLLEVNIYVTAYDIVRTRDTMRVTQPPKSSLPHITNMKKLVRRIYQENGMRLNNMDFEQVQAFIGAQISGYDPLEKQGRGIPSNSVAASYPWIYAHVSDEGGIHLGNSDGVPVFIDFFRRDLDRVNSNMVILGKSGSGKSYATKSLLTNLAADDSKIFILDPENEYAELAANLHGKFINVGNAQYGRLNPFHIMTSMDDDEAEAGTVSGSYATHLQFLEEFFRQILPDCEKDAMEYLNSLIDRMYTNHGITMETDLSRLTPEDYPTFDDLYDTILEEFQQTDNSYIRSNLRVLMNYIAKFSTGGRNANIWNGPSTITTDENFTVFNFQSLLANRNGAIANAQMLLVLKYIDNEIIKNRDYNTRKHLNRKIVVVIDEAHVFIDTKFPVALDFMFQLAKRIRKYNGMQIVITQNIKDFVGSEEIARKSTAIINACQYSFIFALAPNDMQDLCTLYEKSGGINENEQEQITTAPRGQAFTIMSPSSRTTFRVDVPEDVVDMFSAKEYRSRYFSGEDGQAVWEDFIEESRARRNEYLMETEEPEELELPEEKEQKRFVTFIELDEEEDELRESVAAMMQESGGQLEFGRREEDEEETSEGQVIFEEYEEGDFEEQEANEEYQLEEAEESFEEESFEDFEEDFEEPEEKAEEGFEAAAVPEEYETDETEDFEIEDFEAEESETEDNEEEDFETENFETDDFETDNDEIEDSETEDSETEGFNDTAWMDGLEEEDRRLDGGPTVYAELSGRQPKEFIKAQALDSLQKQAPVRAGSSQIQTEQQQGTPAAGVSSIGEIEHMLTELLGRFSYDAMIHEIRRAVKEEIQLELERQASFGRNASSFRNMTEEQQERRRDYFEEEQEEESFAKEAGGKEETEEEEKISELLRLFAEGTDFGEEDSDSENDTNEREDFFFDDEEEEDEEEDEDSFEFEFEKEEEDEDDFEKEEDLAEDDEEENEKEEDELFSDFMDLFAEKEEIAANILPFDRMLEDGISVMDVTFEELTKYNNRKFYGHS